MCVCVCVCFQVSRPALSKKTFLWGGQTNRQKPVKRTKRKGKKRERETRWTYNVMYYITECWEVAVLFCFSFLFYCHSVFQECFNIWWDFFFLDGSSSSKLQLFPDQHRQCIMLNMCWRVLGHVSAQWQNSPGTSGDATCVDGRAGHEPSHWSLHRPHIVLHRPCMTCPMFGLVCGPWPH